MTPTLTATGTPALLVSALVPTRNRVHLPGRSRYAPCMAGALCFCVLFA